MNFGRVKIWFLSNANNLFLGYRFFGRNVVRWDTDGCCHIARSVKKLKHYLSETHKSLSDYGFTTYGFWRFALTVQTKEYNLKNPY